MKKVISKIKILFLKLWFWKQRKEIEEIKGKLTEAKTKKDVQKELLKLQVINYVKKNYHSESKFFQKNRKNNQALATELNIKFKEPFSKFKLQISPQLTFV